MYEYVREDAFPQQAEGQEFGLQERTGTQGHQWGEENTDPEKRKHKCKKGAWVGGGAGGGTGAGVRTLTQAPWASAPKPERAAELAERGRQLESINQNRNSESLCSEMIHANLLKS